MKAKDIQVHWFLAVAVTNDNKWFAGFRQHKFGCEGNLAPTSITPLIARVDVAAPAG